MKRILNTLLAGWGIVGLSACESTLSGTGHTKIVKSDTNSAIIRIYGTDYKAEFKTAYTLADVHCSTHNKIAVKFETDNSWYKESHHLCLRRDQLPKYFINKYGSIEKGLGFENSFRKLYGVTNLQLAKASTPSTEQPDRIVEPPKDQEVIQISSGTGFAITNDGHIVTNNHVIKGCSKVMLANDGKYVPLRVVSNDPTNDLAVLKGDFEPTETFSVNKGNPELMQDIYVAGYPFGKKVSTSVKVTRGIISSLTGYGNNFSGIQIDAAIQPGNSGGPIFDEKGNVVGVVVSKLAKQGDIEPENTNFGVKANILANLLTSNSVPFNDGDETEISKTELSKKASDATFYLSCWNTIAEAKKMQTSKVMFSELE